MGQSSSLFRLSVWKPANPARRLMVCASSEAPFDYQLHEQIYSWAPDEIDIWGSLKDAAQTHKARGALVETFDPSRPVKERGMEQLAKALGVLREILDNAASTDWSECDEYVRSGEDQVNLRANTILLLYRHLEWVWRIFAHVPGASVTVR